MAHVFADLALAGHEAVLPLHEAIDVADRNGRALPPELLCTSEGGCCAAPAAQARGRVPALVRREPSGGQTSGQPDLTADETGERRTIALTEDLQYVGGSYPSTTWPRR